MKALFIIPPSRIYLTYNYLVNPLGILYLASSLEAQGRHEVEVLDCLAKEITPGQLLEHVRRTNPRVVGISMTTDSRFQAFRAARDLKRAFPGITVIGGGPHATLAAEDTLAHLPSFDILVRGEGEDTIRRLLDALEDGTDLATVAGISYRDDQGHPVHNPPAALIKNLDDIPFPAWSKIDLADYGRAVLPNGQSGLTTASVLSSRGCPGKCSFCANAELWQRRTRMRSARNFVDELQYLHDELGVRYLRISDDSFNVNRDRVKEICQDIMARGLDLHWDCGIRVDKVDKEMLALMQRAGCVQVTYGVESVNEKTLNGLIGKNITIAQVEEVTAWLKELNLPFAGGYIISFPGESVADMNKTLEFMRQIGGRAGLNILRIYPGTRIEDIAREQGVLPADFSWSDENFRVKDSLPALTGPVPLYIRDIPWPTLQEALFNWADQNRIGLWKPALMALRGIRGPHDVWRLLQFGLTFLRLKLKGRPKTA